MTHWALFGRQRDSNEWVYCGITTHDELATEFEEELLDLGGRFNATVVVPLEDCMNVAEEE